MLETLKAYKIQLAMAVTLLGFYAAFAYDLERHDFTRLISLYAGAFFFEL
tara:strand:+ start:512 stop:661 length:150 start_codon:yes stop_codon:yes gene_type:complete